MKTIILGAALVATAAGSTAPKRLDTARAKAFDAVVACRSITDSAQRLTCFDQNVGALQEAADKHDIVVVDRQEVREARRSLFGFTLPSLQIFGGGSKADDSQDEAEAKEITTTVRSASQDGMGNWIVVMEDGAVWHQTDGALAFRPKPGGAVTIRRAALGSYFMRIGNQPGVKARRES
jgi:hypothetical protein